MNHQPSTISPPGGLPGGEHRGWSRRMVLWSVALAALLLLLAGAGASWRQFHLMYCRRLMASSNLDTRLEGLGGIAEKHLRTGMTREEVKRLFGAQFVKDQDGGCEVSAGGDGVRLKFDESGRLDTWWWYP